MERGVTLVGGGALLPALDVLLRTETGLPVTIADSPLTTVALGAGQALEELGTLKRQRRHR
jgi:rod shape-determining protein MreB